MCFLDLIVKIFYVNGEVSWLVGNKDYMDVFIKEWNLFVLLDLVFRVNVEESFDRRFNFNLDEFW